MKLTDKDKIQELRQTVLTLLDCVDFHTAKNCKPNEMVGAVLPTAVITNARDTLNKTK